MTPPERKGPERRREPRVPLDWPLNITLADGNHRARLRDVSRGGLCFHLDREIPEMTILALDLDLPPDRDGVEEHIRGSGIVVRCKPLAPAVAHYEVAVFLNDIDSDNRERLDAYVAQAASAI